MGKSKSFVWRWMSGKAMFSWKLIEEHHWGPWPSIGYIGWIIGGSLVCGAQQIILGQFGEVFASAERSGCYLEMHRIRAWPDQLNGVQAKHDFIPRLSVIGERSVKYLVEHYFNDLKHSDVWYEATKHMFSSEVKVSMSIGQKGASESNLCDKEAKLMKSSVNSILGPLSKWRNISYHKEDHFGRILVVREWSTLFHPECMHRFKLPTSRKANCPYWYLALYFNIQH